MTNSKSSKKNTASGDKRGPSRLKRFKERWVRLSASQRQHNNEQNGAKTVKSKPKRAANDTGKKKAKTTSRTKFLRRAEARPDEILDAATKLFLAKGFAASRVEDIARAAGVSKGSIYRYFPSKTALMEGLVKRAISPITDNAVQMIGDFKGDPRRSITLILNMIAARFEDGQPLAIPKLIMREAVSFPEIALMYRRQVLQRMLPVFENMIQKGVADGYFRNVDPELTTRTIMGPIITHLLLSEIFGIEPSDGLALERLVKNHLTILFDGLSLGQGALHE